MKLKTMTAVFALAALTGFGRDCVFFVGAHPDDTEGYAATAFLLAEKYDVHVIDLTRGELGLGRKGFEDGTTAVTRIAEEKAACALLGATPHFLCEIDGDAMAGRDSVEKLAALMREFKPKAVFTHWPVDGHTDHVQTAAVVAHATCLIERELGKQYPFEQYFYEVLLCQTENWHPLYSVDVTATMAKKQAMLRKYVCQNGGDALVKEKTEQAALRGLQHGGACRYAETFTSRTGRRLRGGVLEALEETKLIGGEPSPSEAFLAAARLAYRRPEYAGCTNTIVTTWFVDSAVRDDLPVEGGAIR